MAKATTPDHLRPTKDALSAFEIHINLERNDEDAKVKRTPKNFQEATEP